MPGYPFTLEDKPPEPPGCLVLEDFIDPPQTKNQETRGLDTIQATFFPSILCG